MITTADPYLVRSDEIVDRCREIDRQVASLEAEKSALLGERVQLLLDEVRPGADGFESAERSMVAEVSAALHVSRAAASRALSTGWSLNDRFPATRAALAAGDISLRHAAVIVAGAAAIDIADHDAHARYEGIVVPYATAETAPRTEAFAKSATASVAPETVSERHRRARAERHVRVADADDGMAWLEVLMPSPLAHATYDRITAMARQIRMTRAAQDCGAFHGSLAPKPGQELTEQDWQRLSSFEDIVDDLQEPLSDPRSLDEIRADIVADLLLASDTDLLREAGVDGIRATVQVTIAASTLIGADDRPAELDGHGPIDAELARTLAATAGLWDRLFLDPRGMVTRTDTYAPTERMRRLLRARDQHCRFPGCRMPARNCDMDHNHDYAKGGRTEVCNLCCLCEGHHALKHPDLDARWRWTVTQRPGGVIVWTSPSGRVYIDTPPPRVQFV